MLNYEIYDSVVLLLIIEYSKRQISEKHMPNTEF